MQPEDDEFGDLAPAANTARNLIALAVLALVALAGFAFVLWQMPD